MKASLFVSLLALAAATSTHAEEADSGDSIIVAGTLGASGER